MEVADETMKIFVSLSHSVPCDNFSLPLTLPIRKDKKKQDNQFNLLLAGGSK